MTVIEYMSFPRVFIPYLVTNGFRPPVRVIQRTRPITYHDEGGRALLAARTDANTLMLLSGNAGSCFFRLEARRSRHANPPTPAAAVKCFYCNAVAPPLL
jgi:hypothetical protein